MKNKRGFTLAELLGVIVILLLLVLIVTPVFINYTKKASKTAYEAQVNNIKESAKEWALDDDNAKLLPINDKECIEVTLEKLKEAGYLDYNLKNPNTGDKFDDNLTVIIKKEGKNLTYTFNEDGTETCDTVITTEYPKWVYISSTPSVATDTDEIEIKIKSDRKISEESLDPEDIIVKVGGQIIDDAQLVVSCDGTNPLSCTVKVRNLEGEGNLSLIIDKETMLDEDLNPSRITSIKTDTYVDTTGPEIKYVGKENTNSSIYYATKNDTVTVKFKAEDNENITNNLTKDDIKVYLDGVEINCGKELEVIENGNKTEYALKLTTVEESGKVSIKIAAGKIEDSVGNKNKEKIILPGITFDNVAPVITYDPNEITGYSQKIKATINAEDKETGINEETLKYIFTTDPSATPNVSINNGGTIEKEDLNGEYYIVGYVCDYAGNCTTTPSGIYHMNNTGPKIEIVPKYNTGYDMKATVVLKVTPNGGELDEGSLKYIISSDRNDTVNAVFTNNETVTIENRTGVYYVIAEACDMLGNCTREVSDEFYFDNESPSITYSPNGKTWTKSVNVEVEIKDNIEFDWAKYIVSTSKTATPDTNIGEGKTTKTISGLTGTYYLVSKACDKLANCRTVVSQPYYFDNEKPKITSVAVNGQTATINTSDNVLLKKYEIYNSSGTKIKEEAFAANTTSKSFTYTNTAGGTYKVRVYDHLDNYNEQSFALQYTVTFAVNNGSYGTVSPASRLVNSGGSTTATLAAKTGYHYTSVSGTGCSVSGTTVTAANVTSNRTCTVNFAINQYTVTFASANTNQGTVSPTSATVNYNGSATATITAKSGYAIDTVTGTGCSISGNKVTASGVTSARTCTVKFKATCSYAAGTSWDYSYNGSYHEFTVPCNGTYKLEVWGAQGGDWFGAINMGGLGGHMAGNKALTKDSKLYIVVGGNGKSHNGYNGGGQPGTPIEGYSAAYRGGGASHIATTNRGVLKNYASYQSEVLIVAGGGGGGAMAGSKPGIGGKGGGTNGTAGEQAHNCWNNEGGSGCDYTTGDPGGGGTQTAGGNSWSGGGNTGAGTFGQGGPGWTTGGGGGGGWYGGGAGSGGGSNYAEGGQAASGGGGSGHFGPGVTAVTNETGVWGSDSIADGKARITLVSY